MFKRNKNSEDDNKKIIRECPIFKGLSGSEIKASLAISHIREFATDEKIFTEGTLGLCFYIIAKGSVEIVSDGSPHSKPQVLKEYSEGAFFSEVHLFTETNHTVTCVSKELTRLIIFTKPDFESLIKINPKTGNKLLMNFLEFMGEQIESLYKDNKEMNQKLAQINRD
ncbi:MAG: cyclic nucleotide-binding domain-containing protein, partial [Ignavibacteria bacterium]